MFFGGARGGGKTDGVLGKWALKEQLYGQHFNAIMFRRTTVSSEDAIERAKEIYGKLGARFVGSPIPRFRMPHGGRVTFAYLDSVADADEYQGRNVTDAWVEEAGQYPDSTPIDRLFGVLRSAHGVPIQLILTANPGGAGQHWLRERYGLHPFPQGPKIVTRQLSNGAVHKTAVIPSRIADNRVLMERDPGYVNRLHLVGSEQLVRAWLDGDWTAVEGAFFDCWREGLHVVAPFDVPKDWLRFRSADWGSASPGSIGWWAVAGDDYHIAVGQSGNEARRAGRASRDQSAPLGDAEDRRRVIPRGALVRYREWYVASAPGRGLKLTADAWGDKIAELEKDDPKLTYAVLDPSAFKEEGGPSIGERINAKLIKAKLAAFHGADNARVAQRGAMGGWDQMRGRMIGNEGVPMVYAFSTCRDSIRTIPVLQHDPKRAEDLDTESEDHAADDWRYACMSRPWIPNVRPSVKGSRDRYSREPKDDVKNWKTA